MLHRTNKHQSGFTLIELMLAMAFFTSILIVTTIVLIQVLGIYNKGIVVKQMNSVGRNLTDDIIRVANGSSAKVSTTVPADGKVRCLGIGDTVYVWSYNDDTSLNTNAFKSGGQPVGFSRYTAAVGGVCPAPGASLNSTDLEQTLGDSVRVYAASVGPLDNASNLLRIRFIFGTYSATINEVNPKLNAGVPYCEAGALGNFCSFGTYETVIYLPNQE